MAKSKTFEEMMARLEEIVALMQKGDTPLEETTKLFEEGTKLAAACGKQLAAAEQKVTRLTKGADGAPVEAPFEGGEEG